MTQEIKANRFRFNHDIIPKLDKFIIEMPINRWYKITGDNHQTNIAVIKDYIDKDLLWPEYLSFNEDYTMFMKGTSEGYKKYVAEHTRKFSKDQKRI